MFRLTGLDPAQFDPLFALPDVVLAARGILRRVADADVAFPCRVSLADAAIGEELLLLPWRHHAVDSPYQASGPIYVRRGVRAARLGVGEVPEYVRRRLAAGGRRVHLVGDAAGPAWLPWFDGLHVYTPVTFLARGRDLGREYQARADAARASGVPFVAAVAPGFDDRTIRVPGTLVPRDGGATYDATWRAALAVDPAWVLVASWNEWHEGSEIEPSVELGTAYLEATARWAARFRDGG